MCSVFFYMPKNSKSIHSIKSNKRIQLSNINNKVTLRFNKSRVHNYIDQSQDIVIHKIENGGMEGSRTHLENRL